MVHAFAESSPPLRALPGGALFTIGLLVTGLAAPRSGAQTRWERLDAPGPRTNAAAAFDPVRGRLVVFGGARDYSSFNTYETDTWEWDGSRWERRQPPQSPPPLLNKQMIHDPVSGRCLLLGSMQTEPPQAWSYDGTTWQQEIAPPRYGYLAWEAATQRPLVLSGNAVQPITVWEKTGSTWSARATTGTAPVYPDVGLWVCDVVRGRMVMPAQASDRVFELAGSTWHVVTTTSGPPPTHRHTLCWDPRNAVVLKFGGHRHNASIVQDTLHAWNGTTWQALPTGPSAREFHVAAVDPQGGLFVFGGGQTTPESHQLIIGDLWRFDGAWSLLDDHPSPGHLAGHVQTWDALRGLVVSFGGRRFGVTLTNETWLFDGTRWRLDLSAVRPPAREHAAICYDTTRGRVLVYGGRDDAGLRTDTWEYDAAGWRPVATTVAPSPGLGARMAFDRARGVAVLFGGDINRPPETWELTGSQWQLRASGYPPASSFGGLAYDARRGRTVQFGGHDGNATYEWNGQGWLSTNPAHRPPVSATCTMTWDETRARSVLATGFSTTLQVWEWDGVDWRETTPPPPTTPTAPRRSEGLVYHGGRGQCVFTPQYLGYVTWLYGSANPARWSEYGTGCSSGGVAPRLVPQDGALPWIGDVFPVRMPDAGSIAAFLALGLSDTSWNGVPLPFDLSPIGMPGCFLHTGPDLVLPMLLLSQRPAALDLPIPADRALVGGVLFTQGYALARVGANASRFVVSAGGRAQFGAR